MDEEATEICPREPMASFRNAKKLCSSLVLVKIYPIERRVGSCRRNKSYCQLSVNVNENHVNVTQEPYIIIHELTCDGKCLIYLLMF